MQRERGQSASAPGRLFRQPGLARSGIAVLCLVLFLAGPVAQAQEPGPTATPHMTNRPRLIRPTLPASASQADAGAEVYRLVCSACHGDRGQGLTDAWRATWAPSDQNCWQTKCHGPSHPSDGFELPRFVPPVVGSPVTYRFRTLFDLHVYTVETMPWHEPASLHEDEYWDATAFVARLNGIDTGPGSLNEQLARNIILNPALQATSAVTSVPTATPTAAPTATPPSPAVEPQSPARLVPWLLAALVLVGAVIWLIRRRN